jgi:hypothetical protein
VVNQLPRQKGHCRQHRNAARRGEWRRVRTSKLCVQLNRFGASSAEASDRTVQSASSLSTVMTMAPAAAKTDAELHRRSAPGCLRNAECRRGAHAHERRAGHARAGGARGVRLGRPRAAHVAGARAPGGWARGQRSTSPQVKVPAAAKQRFRAGWGGWKLPDRTGCDPDIGEW